MHRERGKEEQEEGEGAQGQGHRLLRYEADPGPGKGHEAETVGGEYEGERQRWAGSHEQGGRPMEAHLKPGQAKELRCQGAAGAPGVSEFREYRLHGPGLGEAEILHPIVVVVVPVHVVNTQVHRHHGTWPLIGQLPAHRLLIGQLFQIDQ